MTLHAGGGGGCRGGGERCQGEGGRAGYESTGRAGLIASRNLMCFRPLIWMGMDVFLKFDVPNTLNIDIGTLENWLNLIGESAWVSTSPVGHKFQFRPF